MIREFTAAEFWYLVLAVRWTLGLALIAFASGGVVGLGVALCRVARTPALRWLTAGYIRLFQGTPLPRSQWEAAQALALGRAAQLRYVIMPQALRIAVPPTVGFLVQVLKGTSLASIIGFTELTRAAQIVNNATFRPFIVYATVTGLYFALCWPLSFWSQRLERRLDPDRPRALTTAQV